MKKLLLWLLNQDKSNPSFYARIDNVKYYSREFLEAQPPTLSIGNFLHQMDLMDKCMLDKKNGLRVVQGNDVLEATDEEVKDVTNIHD